MSYSRSYRRSRCLELWLTQPTIAGRRQEQGTHMQRLHHTTHETGSSQPPALRFFPSAISPRARACGGGVVSRHSSRLQGG